MRDSGRVHEGAIDIGVPRQERASGKGSCVVAEVAGTRVAFASITSRLEPSPEAFASAFLPVALQLGLRLRSAAPLDPRWREGAERIADRYCSWWNLPRLHPAIEAPDRAQGTLPTRPSDSSALLFSLGVDSFFSHLRCDLGPRRLVTVHGYDYSTGPSSRREAVERSVQEVASETGVAATFIETTLRQHPSQIATNWEANHGGALAAVGHLLAGEHRRLYISSSITIADARPWGSHPTTDAWWSTERLEVQSAGERFNRSEKLRAVAEEPLVRRHLRVCWENRTPAGNCSRCAKCVRTRVTLADHGVLDLFPGFAGLDSLAADIDALSYIGTKLWSFKRAARNRRLPPAVRRALARHLVRYRPELLGVLPRWQSRARDWLARRVAAR